MQKRSLAEYLSLNYQYTVTPEPEGGFFVEYPDLPGCMAQVESEEDIIPTMKEVFQTWMELAYESGQDIPLPLLPGEYSGRLNTRLPRSLHRSLAERAEREGVSLNTYMVCLLSQQASLRVVEKRLDELCTNVGQIHNGLKYNVTTLSMGAYMGGPRDLEKAEMPVAA